MILKPVISSLLSTDLYKFSMGQVYFHQFNKDKTKWSFKCRNTDVKFTPEMVDEIRAQIEHYCSLRFTEEELEWLHKKQPWIHSDYCGFLRFWHPRAEEITVKAEGPCGLSIEAAGSQVCVSYYEIPVLAIVNEVYFRMAYDYDVLYASFKRRLEEKISLLEKNEYETGVWSEFGMRRRLSDEAQDYLVKTLVERKLKGFAGTSNCFLAKKYGIKAVGTMAHEFIMTVGQGHHEYNPAYSNKFALDAWVKEYGILNGIALTDTITTDCFLRDFRLTYATLFSGVRHDSGDPYEWGEKIIRHYESLGIDPQTKTLLFSDSLDFRRATDIFRHFRGRAKIAFGIGTYLANDTDVKPLNIVMKVTEANGQPVAKVSDTPGKGMCKDSAYVDYLERTIKWRLEHEAV